MNKRDAAVIESLKKFRILSRDQLIELHFKDNKTPYVVANRVMNRLASRKLVVADKDRRPYDYLSNPRPIKKDSAKAFHFKAIADFYIDLCKDKQPTKFEVEFKPVQKGGVEPDIFMRWQGYNFYVEMQRSVFSKKQMQKKIDLYYSYYESGKWQQYSKDFPAIWIITDKHYEIEFYGLNVIQTKDVNEFKVMFGW
jgi:hypothetical protein